jgi:hypothetical protein
MSTIYCITFSQNTNREQMNVFLELNDQPAPIMHIRTQKDKLNVDNITYLSKYISNKYMNITFNDENTSCLLNFITDKNYCLIKFDSNSSSAWENFKTSFNSLLNTKKNNIILYPSGNIMYIGDVINLDGEDIADGQGTLYYNTPELNIKYIGKFEDNVFDGKGEFYSSDGHMSILANNCSNGVPTQSGELKIQFRQKQELKKLDFTNIFESFKDRASKSNFVMSDTFVNKIAEHFYNKSEINKLLYVSMGDNERDILIWDRFINIDNKSIENYNILNDQIKSLKNQTKYLSIVLLFVCLKILF